MKSGYFKKVLLTNLIISFAFCMNAIGSENALASGRKTNAAESMLRPQSASLSDRLISVALDMSIQNIKEVLKEKGQDGLRQKLAELAESQGDVKKELTQNEIAVYQKDGLTYLVCLIDNGWMMDLSADTTEAKVYPFGSREDLIKFTSDKQLTWIAGNATPEQIEYAQIMTLKNLEEAGKQDRIFRDDGNIRLGIERYSNGRVNRGLSRLTYAQQDDLFKELRDAFDFRKGLVFTQEDLDKMFPVNKIPAGAKLTVGGNWKLRPFNDAKEARQKAEEFRKAFEDVDPNAEVVLFVEDQWIETVAQVFKGSNIKVGVQSLHFDPNSNIQVQIEDAVRRGATYAMVGHSMHRYPDAKLLQKLPGLKPLTNEGANKIVKAILADGKLKLWYVTPVNEEPGKLFSEQENYYKQQINEGINIGLDGVSAEQISGMITTVEPTADISTKSGDGKIDPKTAVNFPKVEMLTNQLTEALANKFGKSGGEANRGYGASASPNTASTLTSGKNVYNILPGGMSLEVKDFKPLVVNAIRGKFGPASPDLAQVKQDMANAEVINPAIVYDESSKISFFDQGEIGTPQHVAVTLSSGGYKYNSQSPEKPTHSIYDTLVMTQIYMEMAKKDPKALLAYKLKQMHDYFEVTSTGPKVHRRESEEVVDLINEYDNKAFVIWLDRQSTAVRAKTGDVETGGLGRAPSQYGPAPIQEGLRPVFERIAWARNNSDREQFKIKKIYAFRDQKHGMEPRDSISFGIVVGDSFFVVENAPVMGGISAGGLEPDTHPNINAAIEFFEKNVKSRLEGLSIADPDKITEELVKIDGEFRAQAKNKEKPMFSYIGAEISVGVSMISTIALAEVLHAPVETVTNYQYNEIAMSLGLAKDPRPMSIPVNYSVVWEGGKHGVAKYLPELVKLGLIKDDSRFPARFKDQKLIDKGEKEILLAMVPPQELQIMALTSTWKEAYRIGVNLTNAFKKTLRQNGVLTKYGAESGFTTDQTKSGKNIAFKLNISGIETLEIPGVTEGGQVITFEFILDLLEKAVDSLDPNDAKYVRYALDMAASEMHIPENDLYYIGMAAAQGVDSGNKDGLVDNQQFTQYKYNIFRNHPRFLSKEDWAADYRLEHWDPSAKAFMMAMAIIQMGDDFDVSREDLIRKHNKLGIQNAHLHKPNQASERKAGLLAVATSHNLNNVVVWSHRGTRSPQETYTTQGAIGTGAFGAKVTLWGPGRSALIAVMNQVESFAREFNIDIPYQGALVQDPNGPYQDAKAYSWAAKFRKELAEANKKIAWQKRDETAKDDIKAKGSRHTIVPFIEDYSNADLKGKKVLVRVDFNVSDEKGNIKSDKRIKEAISTLEYLVNSGATVVLVSHNGRPDGKVKPELSMGPVAERLQDILRAEGKALNLKVVFHKGSITEKGLDSAVKENLVPGAINVLENTRFYPGEEKNDQDFAKDLANLVDRYMYVFDAFGTAERIHASTGGAARYMQNISMGFLMAKEDKFLQGALDSLHGLIIGGGPKVSEKLPVVKNVIKNMPRGGFIMIGSGPIAAFLKVKYNIEIGQKAKQQDIDDAKEIFRLAEERGVEVVLPVDFTVIDKNLGEKAKEGSDKSWLDLKQLPGGASIIMNVSLEEMKNGKTDQGGIDVRELYAYDIGIDTAKLFAEKIQSTPEGKAIFYNGTIGVDEMDHFALGSESLSDTLAEAANKGRIVVVGGGDTAGSAERNKMSEKVKKPEFFHISTGGGTSAAFLQGKRLAVIAALEKLQAVLDIAKALKVDKEEVNNYYASDETVQGEIGGEEYKTYIGGVAAAQKATPAQKALIVSPEFFTLGGVNSALKELLPLAKSMKIAIYGAEALQLKALLNDKNIIAASRLEDLISVLEENGIKNSDMLLLAPEKVAGVNIKQLNSSQISSLSIAKAVKELYPSEEVDMMFDTFHKKLSERNVISRQAYEANKGALMARLDVAGAFEFSPELKLTQETNDKVKVARESAASFMAKI
jgi:phosphoglycerate kinase